MKQIKKFPNYQIDVNGNIQSLKTGRILKINKNQKGYNHITLSNNGKSNTITIHKLVFTTYIGDTKKGYDINHIDGNKNNNSIINLELVTRKENCQKAVLNGQIKSGFECKLSVNVQQINPLTNEVLDTFGSILIATKKTKIHGSSISSVVNGHRLTAGGFKWKRIN
jgi:hypothetical protein